MVKPLEYCEVVRTVDCDGVSDHTCFRCGITVCPSCSIIIDYKKFGPQRIGLDCLDDMARFGELDHLTLSIVEKG